MALRIEHSEPRLIGTPPQAFIEAHIWSQPCRPLGLATQLSNGNGLFTAINRTSRPIQSTPPCVSLANSNRRYPSSSAPCLTLVARTSSHIHRTSITPSNIFKASNTSEMLCLATHRTPICPREDADIPSYIVQPDRTDLLSSRSPVGLPRPIATHYAAFPRRSSPNRSRAPAAAAPCARFRAHPAVAPHLMHTRQ